MLAWSNDVQISCAYSWLTLTSQVVFLAKLSPTSWQTFAQKMANFSEKTGRLFRFSASQPPLCDVIQKRTAHLKRNRSLEPKATDNKWLLYYRELQSKQTSHVSRLISSPLVAWKRFYFQFWLEASLSQVTSILMVASIRLASLEISSTCRRSWQRA